MLLRMAHAPQHTPRYVPARTNDGWSVVGLVLLLTAALITMTAIIHQRTYKNPTDPTMQAAGEGKAAPEATAH